MKTTSDERDRLDAAVQAAVAGNPRSRMAQIQRDPGVVEALGRMPAGKPDFRYLDNSLQRLRRAGEIVVDGSYWSVKKRGGAR